MALDATSLGPAAPAATDPASPTPPPSGTAVCCSGGGIRSASYNLGALQALAREGVLRDEVDLVSAVSGGAYIASSYALVAAAPAAVPDDAGGVAALQVGLDDAYQPGTPEERHLRQHTHYLLPTAASGLRGVLCIVFGLALNLSLLLGWIVVAVLPVGWVYRWRGVVGVDATSRYDFSPGAVGLWGLPWVVPAALLGVTLLLFAVSSSGVSTFHRQRFHPDRSTVCPPAQGCSDALDEAGLRRWVSCGGAQQAMWWAFASAVATGYLLLAAPWLVEQVSRNVGGSPGGVGHVGAGFGSFFVALLGTVRLVIGGLRGDKAGPAATPGTHKAQDASPGSGVTRLAAGVPSTVWHRVQHVLTPWLGSAIAAAILVAASLAAMNAALREPFAVGQLAVPLILLAYLLVARVVVDVNRTSLHSLYRDRLASAFAVRRAPLSGVQPAGQARLSQLSQLSGRDDGAGRPELVICATANITSDGEVPAGRNGVSFTFTQRDSGLERPLGQLVDRPESDALYRRVPTEDYERVVGLRHLTLLDIVAISGAAVSPVMGSSTRMAERFLLALANVRLGVWLPHPALMPVRPDASAERFVPPDLRACGAPVPAAAQQPALGMQPCPAVPADAVERRMLRSLSGRSATGLARLLAERLQLAANEETLAGLERRLAGQRRARAEAREAVATGRAARPDDPTRRQADQERFRAAKACVKQTKAELEAAEKEQHTGLGRRFWNELRWRGRQPNLRLLLVEALGATSLGNRWLYVTDGGHYDNLGLVEALRRRPDEVFVFDASGDRTGTWAAMGEAVGLVRAELGVRIDIEPSDMVDGHGEVVTPFVKGSYRYADETTDDRAHRLWLCKLGVSKDAPWDVRSFALTHPAFPTDSTLKQLYDGREFEAYRALGDDTATRMLAARRTARADATQNAAMPPVPTAAIPSQEGWVGLAWWRARGPARLTQG